MPSVAAKPVRRIGDPELEVVPEVGLAVGQFDNLGLMDRGGFRVELGPAVGHRKGRTCIGRDVRPAECTAPPGKFGKRYNLLFDPLFRPESGAGSAGTRNMVRV